MKFAKAILLLLILPSAACSNADPATPRPKPERFANEMAVFATQEPQKGGIVFTGSSSIREWDTLKEDFPGLPVVNRGFGGSVANDLIVHVDTVVLRHEPKVLVTYTGSNDLTARLTVQESFEDYTKFLDLVRERSPKTRVVVTSVKISIRHRSQIDEVRELNQKLAEWARGKNWVRYVDTTSYLADAKGKPIRDYYADDLIHLSPAGYAKWKEILTPVLQEEWARAHAA